MISDPTEPFSKLSSVKKIFSRLVKVTIVVLENYLVICGGFKRHVSVSM